VRTPLYSVLALEPLPRCSVSRATAINDKGQVIGYSHNEETDEAIACLWEDGKVHDLGRIAVNSINNKGQIVGERFNASCHFCAILMENRRPRNLFQNNTPISGAKGINDAGQVVGYAQTPLTKSDWPPVMKRGAFCWERGKRHNLDIPVGYLGGKAKCINDHGQVVGEVWEDYPGDGHAALWDRGKAIVIEKPPGFNSSSALAINNNGSILMRASQSNMSALLKGLQKDGEQPDVVSQIVLKQQSFLLKNGQMYAISGLTNALNNSDQVVGWSGVDCDDDVLSGRRPSREPNAIVWQNGEAADLNTLIPNDSGWHLTRADGINNHGQVVGKGIHNGHTRAFLLTPIR